MHGPDCGRQSCETLLLYKKYVWVCVSASVIVCLWLCVFMCMLLHLYIYKYEVCMHVCVFVRICVCCVCVQQQDMMPEERLWCEAMGAREVGKRFRDC